MSRRVPFDEIHLLRLRVEDPSRAAVDPKTATALEFTFGFALTHERKFTYFRVQDHLRRMGLAREALLRLYEESYTAGSDRAAEAEKKDPEAWHRFRLLLSSALQEHRQKPRKEEPQADGDSAGARGRQAE